ncbi:hypothetical protein CRE_11110 [Caenorhabditis remanei]|uniref:F-box domain-containing protein n=2 Tax=Caenorhabditis remanei TaxID=31234 RepID=E3M5M1_CAERE|nr:hypothetical protein CRE_11110 [Caenorhabditis remanei]
MRRERLGSRFPLLQLPMVPLKQVMRNWDLYELFDFSLISKRSRMAVKVHSMSSSIELSVTFNQHFGICVKRRETDYHFQFSMLNPRNQYLNRITPFEHESDDWYNSLNLNKLWIDYLCTIYKCDVVYIRLDGDICTGKFVSLSNWLNGRQKSLKDCIILGLVVDSKEISAFLEKCKITRYLLIDRQQSLKIEPIHCNFQMDLLEIHSVTSTDWLSIDTILTSDCIQIMLGNFKFDETDLNRFLKEWINGSNQRLKRFRVIVKDLNLEVLTSGIEVEEIPVTVERIFENKECGSKKLKLKGGYDIRNNKGMLATFLKTPNPKYPIGTVQFDMFVWE